MPVGRDQGVRTQAQGGKAGSAAGSDGHREKGAGLFKADETHLAGDPGRLPFIPMFLLLGELQVSLLNPKKFVSVLLLLCASLTDVEHRNWLDLYLQN